MIVLLNEYFPPGTSATRKWRQRWRTCCMKSVSNRALQASHMGTIRDLADRALACFRIYRPFGFHGLMSLSSYRLFGRPVQLVVQPTGIKNPVHPRIRTGASQAIPSLCRATPSATSERLLGLLNSRQSLRLRGFLRFLSTEASSLHRRYSVSSVLQAAPSPHAARPVSHEVPVNRDCDHHWDFLCCVWSPLLACHPLYAGRPDGTVRWCSSTNSGLPSTHDRSVPALNVSRPQWRLLALWPARSPTRPKRPSTPKAPGVSSPPPLLRLLTDGANQFPGGILTH